MEKNIIKYREKLGIEPQSVRLVLHLHDELIFEVKDKSINIYLSEIEEIMEKTIVFEKVRLMANGNYAKNWGELK